MGAPGGPRFYGRAPGNRHADHASFAVGPREPMMGVSPEPVPTVTARRRALVVLAAGPTRDAVRRLVAPLVDAVAVATDPFDGTARFAEAPADLVIASLSGWRRKDLAFVTTVRARRPHAAVLVLVPEGRRALAAEALRAGADAALPEPVDLDELSLASRRLLDRLPAAGTGPDAALARLASQIGHAVNNPLQVMSLLLEDPGTDPRAPRGRDALKAEIARVRDAVEIVASFGRLGPPMPSPFDLAALVTDRWDHFARRGLVGPAPAPAAAHRADAPPPPVVEALADAAQVRDAIDAIVRFLAAVAPARPAPLRLLARPSTAKDGRGVEVAARVEGLDVPAERFSAALGAVLEVDDAGRTPFPGLALPAAVAAAHEGALVARSSPRGTVLAFRLPGRR